MRRSNNIMKNFWHNEKVRLVFAYIIIPFISFIATQIVLFFRIKISYPALQVSFFKFFCSSVSFHLLLLEAAFLIPPTLIRFVFIRDGLNYGLTMYFYMLLSEIVSIILVFLLEGEIFFPGIIMVSVYIILSHKAIGYNDMSKCSRYVLTFFTFIILFWAGITGGVIDINRPSRSSIWWEFIIFCHILNSHKQEREKENVTQIATEPIIVLGNKNKTVDEQPRINTEVEVNHKEPEQKIVYLPDDDIADKLICVGLAHIGLKTEAVNKCFTAEIDMERKSIEYPFLNLLMNKFTSEEQRQILDKNFMFFKEVCLFAIYKSLLAKNNHDLYSRVTSNLKTILSEKVYSVNNENRREYFSIFSKKFGEAFQKTEDMNQSLRFAFWSTLAARYPDWITLEGVANILNNDYLFKIFKYNCDAISTSYNENSQ